MTRRRLSSDVVTAAYDRIDALYTRGHRTVVSFSGGKDSSVLLELAILVADAHNQLPVDVIIQDEEIGFPGIYDFIEETFDRAEVRPHWLVMQQPMLNIFNRAEPYWWVMDPQLPPTSWVRQPPSYAEFVADKAIELMVNPERFPVEYTPRRVAFDFNETRQCLVNLIGLRTTESRKRLFGLFSSGGYMAASNDLGVFNGRPIYDWSDGDVWRFLHEHQLPYCKAYDTFFKLGARPTSLRLGPPTLNVHGIKFCQMAAKAWPAWFDRVSTRLPGIRTAVQFGKRAVQPFRRYGETWEQCFKRECLGPATPDWIRERAEYVMRRKLKMHAAHSAAPLPEVKCCFDCRILGSWRDLSLGLWGGDPYALSASGLLEMVEPEFFRPGAGTWAGPWEQKLGRKVKVMF